MANLASYRQRTYTRVDDERTDRALRVTGTIPTALRGSFVQNSPNPRFEPNGLYHWFDGDGMVHGIHFADGGASYRNRYIRTAALSADEAAGKSITAGILEPFEGGRPDKNTANTDLIAHNGKLLALWWLSGEPYALSVPNLETIGIEAFGQPEPFNMAAHAKVDPRTGELVFFDYSPYGDPFLRYGTVSATGQLTHAHTVPLDRPALLHDCAITQNYTVLLDLPLMWDPKALGAGTRRVAFERNAPARFGIADRQGTEVRWFSTGACYMYHTVNAWEEGDEVVITGCRIEDPIPRVPHEKELHIPRLFFLRLEPYLHQWRLNLATGEVQERQLDDRCTEFPRMDDRFLGQRSRYAFHPRVAPEPTLLFDACVRYDLERGTAIHHAYGAGRFGGETVFAPRPGGTEEGDGWVLTFVTDRRSETSDVVLLDAGTMTEVARVHLPRRVPTGFHAEWIAHP